MALQPEQLSCCVCSEFAVDRNSPSSPQSHPFLWPLPHVLPCNAARGSVAVARRVRVSAHPCACALVGTAPESLWPARGWLCSGQGTCVQPPWPCACARVLGSVRLGSSLCTPGQAGNVPVPLWVPTAVPELASQPTPCKPHSDCPAQQSQALTHTQPHLLTCRSLERPTALPSHRRQSPTQAIPLMPCPCSLVARSRFPGSLLQPPGEALRFQGSGGSVGMGESRGLCPEPGAMGK